MDGVNERDLAIADGFDAGLLNGNVLITVVLVVLAQGGDVLIELVIDDAAGLGEEGEDIGGLGLDDLLEFLAGEYGIALEMNRFDDCPCALGDVEGDRGGAGLIVDIGVVLDVGLRVAVVGVLIEDFLAILLERGFVKGLAGLGGDVLAQLLGADGGGAFNINGGDIGLRLDDDDDANTGLHGLAENTDIGYAAGGVKSADVILDGLLRVGLADGGAHIGENLLAGEGCGAGVLDIDLADNRRRLRLRRRRGGSGLSLGSRKAKTQGGE